MLSSVRRGHPEAAQIACFEADLCGGADRATACLPCRKEGGYLVGQKFTTYRTTLPSSKRLRARG